MGRAPAMRATAHSADDGSQSCVRCEHARLSAKPGTVACSWLTSMYGEVAFALAASKLKQVWSGIGFWAVDPNSKPHEGAQTGVMVLVNATDRCPKWEDHMTVPQSVRKR